MIRSVHREIMLFNISFYNIEYTAGNGAKWYRPSEDFHPANLFIPFSRTSKHLPSSDQKENEIVRAD